MPAPAILPETRFCADPPGGHMLVVLDDFTALYHRRSAQTHLVNEPVPEIIAALEGCAMTPSALLTALSADNEVEADGDLLAALAARLAELETLGLVFRA